LCLNDLIIGHQDCNAIRYGCQSDQIFIDNAIEKGANEIWIKGKVETDQMRQRIAHYAA